MKVIITNKIEIMNNLKIGIATGIGASLFYLGCFSFMKIAGIPNTVKLSNLLFHGMDFTNIIRTNIPICESIIGLFVSFIFWGSLAYLIAFTYSRLNKINRL